MSSLKWFETCLCDRSQKCSINQWPIVKPHRSFLWLPQGSNLRPLLFFVYITDLPSSHSLVFPGMFADDTSITVAVSTMTDLENVKNLELRNLIINRWLITNRLSLNVAKNEFMVMDELNITLSDKLQKLQNRAARIISGSFTTQVSITS